MNLTGKYWIVSHWDANMCIVFLYFLSLPFHAEIQEREICGRAGSRSCWKPVSFTFWKGLYSLKKSSQMSLDRNGGHSRALREERSGFVCLASSRDMSIVHVRTQGRPCGRLRESRHLVLPKIPLPRGLDGGSRDKGAAADTVNEHLIPTQCGQTSDDSGELFRSWC